MFLICIIVLLCVIFLFQKKNEVIKNKGRGYCNIQNEYVKPKLYDNFINSSEAKHILNLANPLFRESRLVSGFSENVRKSQTAWLSTSDPVVKNIIQRVCSITNIPFENAEKMQVVKYEPNGFYNPHFDASCDDKIECVEFEKNGGQRKVTMILYCKLDNFQKL